MSDEVIQQLKEIAKAIRALEGMEVDYHLGKQLSEVLRTIAQYCAPAA